MAIKINILIIKKIKTNAKIHDKQNIKFLFIADFFEEIIYSQNGPKMLLQMKKKSLIFLQNG